MGANNNSDCSSINWQALYPNPVGLPPTLTDPISQEEVREAIQSWPTNKTPGPDGFTGEFFKFFSNELIPEIVQTLNSALQNSNLDPLNSSYIVLIPKKTDAILTSDYRPISIVHSMQRIISKILAARCAPSMQQLVLRSQTGFISGRSIIDNFLYAQDLVQWATRSNITMGILKADVHKAFDTVDWVFLCKVLTALGFPTIWVHWISGCVLKGNSRVIVNAQAGKQITLRRGVRQGDALSPYLFILAFDFLNRWLTSLQRIEAITTPLRGLVPALFYADDSLVFFKPEINQLQILKLVLSSFEKFSGLKVNWNKSQLMVIGQSNQDYHSLADFLGCAFSNFPTSYLGLPLSDKKLKNADFLELLQKFEKKLKSWSASLLSVAGRKTLLNACLTAIPIYFMSAFVIPTGVINKIDKIRKTFFWHGTKKDQSKINLIAWHNITKPKKIGGLGVLDLRVLNQALIAKWAWKWLSKDSTLWKDLATILQNGAFSIVPAHSSLSPHLLKLVPVLQTTTFSTLKSGNNTSFWHQDWGIGILSHSHHLAFSYCTYKEASVRDFLQKLRTDPNTFLPSIFNTILPLNQLEQIIQSISTLNLQDDQYRDCLSWKTLINGENFKVQNFYNIIKTVPKTFSNLNNVWKLKIPPRMSIFVWQMLQNKIATIDNLMRKGFCLPNICILCKTDAESVIHLFHHCSFFSQIAIILQAKTGLNFNGHFHQVLLHEIFSSPMVRNLLALTCFLVWRERCNRIFREEFLPPIEVSQLILQEFNYFRFSV